MRIDSHNFRIDNVRQKFLASTLAYLDAGIVNQFWVDVKGEIQEQMGFIIQLDDHVRWRALLGVTPR
jgi:hypothetical protein